MNQVQTKQRILADKNLIEAIHDVADTCMEAFCEGNKVLFCGNGGSAADAQHLRLPNSPVVQL